MQRQSINLIGKYSSPSNPIFAIDVDKDRTHILVGHRSELSLLLVNPQSGPAMFDQKCKFQTENLKQLSWNKLMTQKIAVASQNQIIVYDMEKQGDQDYAEKYKLNNRNNVGVIHHIEWKNNHANVMLVTQGNMFRIWDLRVGSIGSGTQLNFLSQVQFDGMIPKFRVNKDDTLMGSFSKQGYIKLYDLRRLGHDQFSSVLYSTFSQGCNLFEFDPVSPNSFFECNRQFINTWDLAGDRAVLKSSINSIISATHITRSKIINPDLLFILGEGKPKTLNGVPQTEIHCFNMRHKFRPERFYNLGQMNKILDFTIAQKAGVLVVHQKERLLGFSLQQYLSHYDNAPCNPVLFDEEWHQLIYNLQMPSDIVKRCDKKFSKPIIYADQPQITYSLGMSFKQQLQYIHEKYKILGPIEDIGSENAKVAKTMNKKLCEDMWDSLPLLIQQPIIQQEQTSRNSEQSEKSFNIIQNLLQQVIDQGELPTAVYYAIVVHNANPSLLASKFIKRIFVDYIQILRKFQLYYIAARICIDSKTQEVTQTTKKNTTVKVMCTKCDHKLPQKQSSCASIGCTQLVCFCKQPLKALILWCQGCSHGFHIQQAIDWFSQTDQCPYACGHKCYKILQKDIQKIQRLKEGIFQSHNHFIPD